MTLSDIDSELKRINHTRDKCYNDNYKMDHQKAPFNKHSKLYEKQIMENPQEFFTQDVLEKINEYIHEEFSYGGYTEELPLDSLDEDVLEKE